MDLQFSGLEAIQARVQERLTKMTGTFRAAVIREKEVIQSRTQAGYDWQGAQFPGYSPGWAQKRKVAGKQTQYVDLTFSGDMFKAYKIQFEQSATSISATLYFEGETAQLKARGNQQSRNSARVFFKLNPGQTQTIISKLRSLR